MEKLTMNTKELSAAMGISYPLALELTEREGFPCIRIGRRKVIPVDRFKAWLDAQAENQAPALAVVGAPARRA